MHHILENGLNLFFQVSSVLIVEADYGASFKILRSEGFYYYHACIMESKMQLQNLAAS